MLFLHILELSCPLNLICLTDDPNASESVANVFNVKSSTNKPSKDMSKIHRPVAPIIEDWISDSEDETEIEPVPTAVTQSSIKSLWPVKHVVNKEHSHGNKGNAEKASAYWIQVSNGLGPQKRLSFLFDVQGNPHKALKDKGVIDSGCSKHMTGNIYFLSDFEEIDGGYVAFGGNPKGGFQENNMYNVDLNNVVPSGGLTCLFAKATLDESNLCNRRHGQINFKTMNKLVKGNLVRGLPSKIFENNHTFVACQKGKQHRASCKSIPVSSISQPLQRLHMDLFGPTFVKSLNKKSYCIVVTDDYSRVLVTKPHNKTPYELLVGRSPSIGFMRPFGCLVTILNTLDPLGKFDDPQNTDVDADAAFDVKENETDVHVFANGSDKTANKKHDEKAKRDDRGKSHVDSLTRARNLRAELEEFSFNGTNRVNAVTPQTRSMIRMVKEQGRLHQINDENFHTCLFACFLSQEEPNKVHQSLKDPSWIKAMQEELLQLKLQKVWVLVDLPKGKRAICSKWVFRNKRNERGIVRRNKARLVAQGHTQEEGIDYDVVFAPLARIEAIRLFLAYASFMGFMVYQMDVKSDFLYGTIEEEVYVCQPLGFEDHDYPAKVYKVVKALYGLHQAPRAWYETLAYYLLENRFQRRKIDQTLFIKKQKGDILLVQVYMDDIIFGSTNKKLCKAFEKLMKDKF
nr:retrovirus-related Pol polyprotein from transposon TNT 1-94 [Tanacetum cinerariifolium]